MAIPSKKKIASLLEEHANVAALIRRYKANGLDARDGYNQLVIDRQLRPGIDAADFHILYGAVEIGDPETVPLRMTHIGELPPLANPGDKWLRVAAVIQTTYGLDQSPYRYQGKPVNVYAPLGENDAANGSYNDGFTVMLTREYKVTSPLDALRVEAYQIFTRLQYITLGQAVQAGLLPDPRECIITNLIHFDPNDFPDLVDLAQTDGYSVTGLTK